MILVNSFDLFKIPDRIMPLMRERGIFMLAVRVLDSIYNGVLSSHLLTAYETLAMLVDTVRSDIYCNRHFFENF